MVAEGDTVDAGQTVATIEAMKMEAAITAPAAGTVERLAVSGTRPGRGRRPAAGDRLSRRDGASPSRAVAVHLGVLAVLLAWLTAVPLAHHFNGLAAGDLPWAPDAWSAAYDAVYEAVGVAARALGLLLLGQARLPAVRRRAAAGVTAAARASAAGAGSGSGCCASCWWSAWSATSSATGEAGGPRR